MIENTFCHIKGIGLKTEANLWEKGIRCWSDWQKVNGQKLSGQSSIEIPDIFQVSHNALQTGDANFFCSRLPASECWRLFVHFREHLCYLDIETTGLGIDAEITTIALYDGKRVFTYVNGKNLQQFTEDIQRFSVLVSYNGKSFDIPCIEKYFNISLPQAQIDLRFVLARLGYKGGLKGCERHIGLHRGSLDGVDGSFAVHLWHLYDTLHSAISRRTAAYLSAESAIYCQGKKTHGVLR